MKRSYLVVYKAAHRKYLQKFEFLTADYAFEYYNELIRNRWVELATLYRIEEDDVIMVRQHGKDE